ncbi:CPBP family intramembrane glutamic endopeptidase [Cohnella boryungensis]|uniref:Type II CAAX prenyl endopeptidase Rce1 family protein n=1 Tax=Cohnella boryungensis TaxID=768479 RepID=A0ABV8S8K3_9BACL
MNPQDRMNLDKRWVWAAAVGLVIFLFIQVFPITGQLFAVSSSSVLTRAEAKQQALKLAGDNFGLRPDEIDSTTVTHMTDSKTTGYFSKNKLLNVYDKQWADFAPTDVYAIKVYARGLEGALVLSIDMENGRLVSWQHLVAGSVSAKPQSSEVSELTESRASRALNYAAMWSIDTERWEWSGVASASNVFEFVSRQSPIGEAQLRLRIAVPEGYEPSSSAKPSWQGGSVTYSVDLPASFNEYMKQQQKWASLLSAFGFILPQVLMMILAIIYAGTLGGLTSYRRGIFLAGIYFALYASLTFNMIPGLRAETWESGIRIGDQVNLVFRLVTFGVMALFTYFSAVGGDGLWKSMGHTLWPRWQERGYGAAVLRSMKEGYFLAFILLGSQSLILLALEKSLGSFAASDAAQSMYNMSIPLLLPLLAWCAGISEELQSRLFGIGLFRKWFVGLARLITGKSPSPRAAAILTAAAIVPPGLIWALGHVGYAIFPVYTRVIELVLMSFLFGWFMLRFGVMTVIFAHVTLDAVLMGMQMMFDGLPGDFAGGMFSLVFPALVGIVIWKLHGGVRLRT